MISQDNDKRIFHGNLTPDVLANALAGQFHTGPIKTRILGTRDHRIIQIATTERPASGGHTSLAIHLLKVEDGVMVQIGDQEWLGIAASLGKTVLSALWNPINLLGRLDDIAQDIDSMQLKERIWETIQQTAESLGASTQISERLRRLSCPYCDTANQVGAPNCIACGGPLGSIHPVACPQCGYVVRQEDTTCPQCKARL